MIEPADTIYVVYTVVAGDEIECRTFVRYDDAEGYAESADVDDFEVVEYSRAE
jgi:hypothetical protein